MQPNIIASNSIHTHLNGAAIYICLIIFVLHAGQGIAGHSVPCAIIIIIIIIPCAGLLFLLSNTPARHKNTAVPHVPRV